MTTIDVPGLTLRTLDASAAEEGHPDRDLLHGWGEALSRGFHEGRPTDEHRAAWLAGARADGIGFRGLWPQRTGVAARTLPVATYASWAGGDLNVGGGHSLQLHMITDVTVAPTHRRQGLLRALIESDLREAAGRGRALAGLTVSEGSIYGRFGFGPASRLRSMEVDVTGRFQLRPFTDDGSIELVEPAELWPLLREIQGRHQQSTRGALTWPGFYESFVTGRFRWDEGGPDHKLRIAVHIDATGTPDGFASWKHAGDQDGRATVDVSDVICTSPIGYLALWQLLAGIDLTERVRWGRAPLVDPLEWAVTDPRCIKTSATRDTLWVRVLDLVAALEARPWYADGSVVLGVDDPLGLIDGCWRVTVSDGRADVARADEAAEVDLSAETLGSLYLGGVDTATLRAAGRLGGDDRAVSRWSAMADGGPAPYFATGF